MEKYKLSDLIREGSKKHPQNFGGYFALKRHSTDTDQPQYTVTASCALGAAAIAVNPSAAVYKDIDALGIYGVWDDIKLHMVPEVCRTALRHRTSSSLFHIIAVLNDTAKWTREQIADWLESIGY